jgi:hypothetical protein
LLFTPILIDLEIMQPAATLSVLPASHQQIDTNSRRYPENVVGCAREFWVFSYVSAEVEDANF